MLFFSIDAQIVDSLISFEVFKRQFENGFIRENVREKKKIQICLPAKTAQLHTL